MAVDNIREKLENVVSKKPSKWLEEANWRRENQAWLKRSQAIAIKIITRLDELHMNQKQLAEKIGVSAQMVNKWVKGKENLTLETISKLETHLGIQLIQLAFDSLLQNIEYEDIHSGNEELIEIHSKTKVIPLQPEFSIESNDYNLAV
jgi:transcriptional regulator with XRE-family HTH domain